MSDHEPGDGERRNGRAWADADRDVLIGWAYRAQKLNSLGQVAGSIAHDLNNLFMAILGRAELAASLLPPGSPAGDHLKHVATSGRRAAELVNQLLLYSGRGRTAQVKAPWSEAIRDMVPLIEVAVSKRCRVVWEREEQLPPVEVDSTDLRQLLLNLALNASEAVGDGLGTITIRTGKVEADRAMLDWIRPGVRLPEGSYVFVEVVDTGAGMTPEVLAWAFEPLFTTKGEGRGMGLPAVKAIAERHGGAVTLTSSPGAGTTARVLLRPLATAATSVVAAPQSPEAAALGGTALVADDEEPVRELMTLMLERAGFKVVTVPDGTDAVDLVARGGDEFAVALLDLTMAKVGGEEAFRKIHALRPSLPVIITTGFGEQSAVQSLFEDGLAGFLAKPASSSQLVAAIRKALARPR